MIYLTNTVCYAKNLIQVPRSGWFASIILLWASFIFVFVADGLNRKITMSKWLKYANVSDLQKGTHVLRNWIITFEK